MFPQLLKPWVAAFIVEITTQNIRISLQGYCEAGIKYL